MKTLVLIFFGILIISCSNDALPKPNGYLRLEYPKAVYENTVLPLPFTFDKNKAVTFVSTVKKISNNAFGIDINYPTLKGTIYLTYKTIKSNNIDSLLRDAQNLTQKHNIKADAISSTRFENFSNKVYGMLYEVEGNAASQSQFYVTDSIKHFLNGSLYFYAKPNYDSIYPASEYLKNDIKRIMETVKWNY